jgi:UDP-N-acetylmuramoyl-tripeptide--D-alanyl-D-alanine ligase
MLSASDVIAATGGEAAAGEDNRFSGVSIDSRTIKEGDLFFAIKGDRFDGHDFVKDALKTGGGVVVDKNFKFQISNLKSQKGKAIILVDNTLYALHNLARFLRKRFGGCVIAVAGSNGKTTTKELISSILGARLNVLKTEGNLNNHIGMPLSIAKVSKDTEAMVLEMGTNMPGDVDLLCSIAMPDIGVVTNIGYEHLEGFGTIERVRDSELEIIPYVKKLVINADDTFLMGGISMGFKGELITFGIKTAEADIIAKDISFEDNGTRFVLAAHGEEIEIKSRLAGFFNVYNSLAAAAAAYAAGMGPEDIKKGLESFGGVNMRFEVKRHKGAVFLNDVYNANPSSMEESLKELERRFGAGKYKRSIAVLGDMLELGGYEVSEHEKLGRRLSELHADIFIAVGKAMRHAVGEFKGKCISVGKSEDAGRELGNIMQDGDLVLIKGSRGMKMENVLEYIMKREVR